MAMLHPRAAGSAHRARRWAVLVGIVLVVLLAHAWVGRQFAAIMQEWHQPQPALPVVEVTSTGTLKPMEPPRRPRAAPAPMDAAPSPQASAEAAWSLPTAADLPAEPQANVGSDAASAPAEPVAAAPAPVPAPAEAAPSAAAAADPWPPSTRIRYRLRGNFRGEFAGSAQVLWLRDADRYRVELEVLIGPRAAPIVSRRVISEGRLGSEGLVPRRYEEETRLLFSRTRRVTLSFEPGPPGQPGSLVLPDGTRRPAPAGTQDSASQFVQLAWLLSTQPTPVKAGDRVSLHLALSRRSDLWTYVVGEPVMVDTPAGPVQALHALPQRELDPLRRDLLAEVWFAPSLQYLPVRMQVMVDTETYALMVMDGLPEVVNATLPPPGDRLPSGAANPLNSNARPPAQGTPP